MRNNNPVVIRGRVINGVIVVDDPCLTRKAGSLSSSPWNICLFPSLRLRLTLLVVVKPRSYGPPSGGSRKFPLSGPNGRETHPGDTIPSPAEQPLGVRAAHRPVPLRRHTRVPHGAGDAPAPRPQRLQPLRHPGRGGRPRSLAALHRTKVPDPPDAPRVPRGGPGALYRVPLTT